MKNINKKVTHSVQQLPNHTIPLLGRLVLRTVLAVLHEPERVVESQDVGYFFDQINAEAFEFVVPLQLVLVLLPHHIRRILTIARENTVTCLFRLALFGNF